MHHIRERREREKLSGPFPGLEREDLGSNKAGMREKAQKREKQRRERGERRERSHRQALRAS
jgi:hypothetical protein